MDILVALDENYIPPLRTMLTSLFLNNPDEHIDLWLLHSAISQNALEELAAFCGEDAALRPVKVDAALFENAPTSKRYTQEMYYRLLAGHLLPKSLRRVLYLDPDTLVIAPLKPLFELDMQGHIFAAAAHTGKTELANDINRLRLGTHHVYFNSGVLLIDLERARNEIKPEDIFSFAGEYARVLILPDQDILNSLYGARTLGIDDAIWNYDVRNFSSYMMRSGGEATMPWVMENTAVLHFAGAASPGTRGTVTVLACSIATTCSLHSGGMKSCANSFLPCAKINQTKKALL